MCAARSRKIDRLSSVAAVPSENTLGRRPSAAVRLRLRARLTQLRATSALRSGPRRPAGAQRIKPDTATPQRRQPRRVGDNGRTDSYVSHNVVEMAEMAADQHRDALRAQRASASQRLRDRLLVRQGLLTQPARASSSTKTTAQSTAQTATPGQQAAAHEEALTTSHRVQVEARRASKLHAERTSQRKSMSDRRLAARLQARNKVKSSRCLEKCPAFSALDQGSLAQIVDAMEYSTVDAGETLCREGAAADKMFVLVSGTCDVSIGGSRVASLRELDVLGESALFPDATGKSVRSATVRCTAPSALLVLHKAELDTLIQSGALPQECVSALAAVAERRRQENEALCRQAK